MDDFSQEIPRIIWFLWFQGHRQAPEIVRRCFQSWLRHNSTYKIVFLSRLNLQEYIDVATTKKLANLSLAHQSDLIRLELLEKHGGVWVDATCFCTRSLDSWLNDNVSSGFFAFRNPGPDRLLSNWFLAAQKGSVIAKELLNSLLSYWMENELSNIGKERVCSFFEKCFSKSPKLAKLWFSPLIRRFLRIYPYFVFHYKFAELIEIDDRCLSIWNATPAISADIPHRLLHVGLMNDASFEIRAEIEAAVAPLYKLTWRIANEFDETTVVGCLLSTA